MFTDYMSMIDRLDGNSSPYDCGPLSYNLIWAGLPVELHEDDGDNSVELLCFADDALVDYGDESEDGMWAGIEVGFKNYPHAEKYTYWIEL